MLHSSNACVCYLILSFLSYFTCLYVQSTFVIMVLNKLFSIIKKIYHTAEICLSCIQKYDLLILLARKFICNYKIVNNHKNWNIIDHWTNCKVFKFICYLHNWTGKVLATFRVNPDFVRISDNRSTVIPDHSRGIDLCGHRQGSNKAKIAWPVCP